MDGLDFNDTLKYLIDAVSTSHWAEIILLMVVLIALLGGGFLVYKRMGSTERLIMRMLDILAPGHRPRNDGKETEEDSDAGKSGD